MFFKKICFLFFIFYPFATKLENKNLNEESNENFSKIEDSRIENSRIEEIKISENTKDLEINENIIKNDYFLKPVTFTKNGIETFLKDIYNNHEYKNFLSSCLIHIIDFLENSENTSNPKIFTQKSLNIFIQKIHEISFLNPFTFLYFLQQSNQSILNIINSEKIKLENGIEKIIEEFLLNEFELLKENPKEFIKKISKKISNFSQETILDYSETQKVFCDLIEILSSKLVFDISDFHESWSCFKSLCSTISYLYDIGIIYSEDKYQRILWAISSKFKSSCELQNEFLSEENIKIFIEDEISENLPLIFYKEETEKNILKKIEFLIKIKDL